MDPALIWKVISVGVPGLFAAGGAYWGIKQALLNLTKGQERIVSRLDRHDERIRTVEIKVGT